MSLFHVCTDDAPTEAEARAKLPAMADSLRLRVTPEWRIQTDCEFDLVRSRWLVVAFALPPADELARMCYEGLFS